MERVAESDACIEYVEDTSFPAGKTDECLGLTVRLPSEPDAHSLG
jgi:hypothetical protein